MSDGIQSTEKKAPPKGRRVTVDLTPAATQEVDRLREITELSTADLFRHAMSLLRIYINARRHGLEVRLIDRAHPEMQTLLELPISIPKLSEET